MALKIKGGPAKRQEEARLSIDRLEDEKRQTGYNDWAVRLTQYDVQWRGTTPRENKPWEHASDYNPPLTFSKVEDVHSLLFGYFSNFNFFELAPANTGGLAEEFIRKRANLLSDLLRWSMMNESNSLPFLDTFLHDGCVWGCAFGYMPYLRDSRMMQAEIFLPDELRRSEEEDDIIIQEALRGQLREGPDRRKDDRFDIRFIDADGLEKDGIAWIDREHPDRPPEEAVLIVEREQVFYDAPRPRNVAPWDLIIPADVRDLQTARRFWFRQFYSIQEIAMYHRQGLFNALSRDELKDLREYAKRHDLGGVSSSVDDEDTTDAQRDAELLVSKLESRSDLFKVYYEYAFEDINDDGIPESIVRAVLDWVRPVLLMRHRLEYLFPHGRRPFFDWHLVKLNDRYYGMGIPEILERAQREENAFYQARNDVIEIITKPGGMYDPMSGLAPQEIRYKPGMMVKARDVNTAFRPFDFPVEPTHLLREQSGIDMQAERAIGSTDMGLGRGPTRPNAPRTLGGTAIVVRQQQLRSDVFLKRAMYGSGEYTGGVMEFLQQYLALLQTFMPSEKEFRTLGTDEIRRVQREDVQGRYDFLVDFGPELTNPQLRMQNAILRYQNLIQNPLVLRNPLSMWKISVDLMESTGMRSAARWLPPPDPSENRPPMDQDDEFHILGKGIYIAPIPSENHEEHIAKIANLMSDQMRLAQLFGPNEIPLLARHFSEHQEMLSRGPTAQGMGQQGGIQGPQQQQGQSPYGQPPPLETFAGVPDEAFEEF